MSIILTNDTSDTVLACSECGEKFRGRDALLHTMEDWDGECDTLDEFIAWFIYEVNEKHECGLIISYQYRGI